MYAVRNGYRTDCSGYVSGVLKLPSPGWSTVDLPDLCTVIDPKALELGDPIGLMGPGTGGAAGHVMSFESHDRGGFWVWQQSGGRSGQYRSWIPRMPAGYLAYRYDHFTTDQGAGMSFRVRSGASDGSIYLAPGGLTAAGKIACFAIYGTEYEVIPLIQLPPGITVTQAGIYDVNPKPWTANGIPVHTHDQAPTTGPITQQEEA